MTNNSGQRIHRAATEAEKERHRLAREQIASELPEIKARGREALEKIRREGTPISYIVSALRAERERQGISLADLNQRSGIDRAALSRLENNEEANPTLNTLQRYAAAIGKEMVVVLTDAVVER
jgi:DNA-binding phage protein